MNTALHLRQLDTAVPAPPHRTEKKLINVRYRQTVAPATAKPPLDEQAQRLYMYTNHARPQATSAVLQPEMQHILANKPLSPVPAPLGHRVPVELHPPQFRQPDDSLGHHS